MKYTVVITDSAATDLESQFEFLYANSRDRSVAQDWLMGIYQAVNELEEFAGYARARESDYLDADLRQKVFKSHRIVFEVDEARRVVTVHYVRHGRQRAAGELSGEN